MQATYIISKVLFLDINPVILSDEFSESGESSGSNQFSE